MTPAPETFEGLIFDLDGLLADTQSVWRNAQARIFAQNGRPYGHAEETVLLGISREAAGVALATLLGRRKDEATSLYKQLHELVGAELHSGVKAMPGALELVAASKESGKRVGLASNGQSDLVNQTLISIGAGGLFDTVVTASDVTFPKPAPDVYREACRRLKVAPGGCIALEDSPTGVESALAAGLRVVLVPSPGAECVTGPILVVDSLADRRVWDLIGLDGHARSALA